MTDSDTPLGEQLAALVAQAQPLLDAHEHEAAQELVNEARALDPEGRLQHPASVHV